MGQLQSPSIILLPVLGFRCGVLSPSHHWLISEGWNKNAACPICGACSVLDKFLSKWSYFILMEDERGAGATFGAEETGMLHLFPDLLGFWPFVPLLTEGVCLTTQAGKCWHTLPSFLIGSSNEEKCLGIFFPLHDKAGSQENLPPKLFQSPSTCVASLSRAQKCPGSI